ncbi:MAG TPA: hypothetical protein VGU61_04240 [Noviherbaspirillum sp.]|jgi:hypothetical protein|uniref:hypothetical protein n=1 Tax=Noviherbaspirillum sp. TaxID=1926288 RepID=UPI002DDDA36F|nr:hypothetical protein [Noviherbaspirillum sp.]HEV2609454.1 hypothetical protein [Noviherbaspirillum sp.]
MLTGKLTAFTPTACILCAPFLIACGGGSSGSVAQTTASAVPAKTEAQISEEMQKVWASLIAEVGTPLASDVSQCRAIPAGAKACGGPSRYVVYSTQVSNEERVRNLAESYTALENERNVMSHAISTCSLVMPPVIELAAGRCQAK